MQIHNKRLCQGLMTQVLAWLTGYEVVVTSFCLCQLSKLQGFSDRDSITEKARLHGQRYR